MDDVPYTFPGGAMTPFEREEAFAHRLIALGNGSHPLPEHRQYDEAVVSFSAEEPERVWVFLRRDRRTRRAFHFQIVPAGPPERQPDDEDSPRDVRLALAERFLLETVAVMHELPPRLQRSLLRRALDNLTASGRIDRPESDLLEALLGSWPAGQPA